MKQYSLIIKLDNDLIPCVLNCTDNSKEFQIYFTSNHINFSVSDTFPFFCLAKIRMHLEHFNLKLLCNGSKLNVYPSGASAIGFNAYELEIGKPAIKQVNIFNELNDLNMYSTVEEQKKFREKWILSLLEK